MTIYQAIVAAGIETDNHESDLYVPVCQESIEIVKEYNPNRSTFISKINGKCYYDIPFAFDPWWEKRGALVTVPTK